jgi:sigma-B regulation protein RsbU (phosphoserine phosphatase)
LGGDYYDVLAFSEARVAVAIADAIGRGMPAALLMSNLQAAVRAFAMPASQPEDVCQNVNALLARSMAKGKFITFCYSLLDLENGTITYCNAGHSAPMLSRRNGSIERLDSTGLVIGINDDEQYTTGVMRLEPGDRLVWFTDGVTEARSNDGQYFSDERLMAVIAQHVKEPPDRLAALIVDAVRQWTGGSFDDDLTVLVLAVRDVHRSRLC